MITKDSSILACVDFTHRIASICNPTDLFCTDKNRIGAHAPQRIISYSILGYPLKRTSKTCTQHLQCYAPPTTKFDGWTKRSMSLLEALFKGVITRFGIHDIEKCFEKTHRTFRSAIEIRLLGGIRFWPNIFDVPNLRLFRRTFQVCEYRIWATKRWKVLRKRILKCWFGLP